MHERFSRLTIILIELRKSVRLLLISLISLTMLIFFLSSSLIAVFQEHLHEKVYFFSVAGPFLAHVKTAFFAAVYLLMPLFVHILWQALGKPFAIKGRTRLQLTTASCLLFYIGTLFCYFITLPYGIRFLLSFQSENLRPLISIDSFVNFITIFVLAFGLLFELPVFMIFSVQTQVLSRRFYEQQRRFAILGIAILAALLTPTPDVVNMALMGGPLYLLYEFGILVIRLMYD